jgi:hypothetical protein
MATRLTPAQTAKFRDRVRPTLRFLFLCRRRLEERGFDSTSQLYQAVDKAYDAIHSLYVRLHYDSCGRGVGRQPDHE